MGAEPARAPRVAIGIDIGGTGLKIGRVDLADPPTVSLVQVLSGHAVEAPERVIEQMAAAIRGILDEEDLRAAELVAIGIGCAGLVDSDRGILHTSPNLPAWHDVPLAAELAARFPVPVRLVNDAQAFLGAEWLAGAARGCADALFVTLGTGVGGGMVLAGRPYRGPGGLGAEIGHMAIDFNGPACPCGNRGCLELYVGRAAIERMAAEAGLAAEGADSPKRVQERAAAGDPRAIALFAEVGRALGAGLAGLVNLLEPEVIVVGGGVAGAGDLIFGPAAREMAIRSMVARQTRVTIRPAQFGPRAGIAGAALLAAQRVPAA